MTNTIVVKSGAGTPSPDSLQEAELALDTVNGDLYTKLSDGSITLLNESAGSGTGSSVHIGELPPANPQEGQQWMEVPASGDATMWIYDGAVWLQMPGGKDGADGQDGADGGIEEAPEDGLQYVRQDAGWSEIVVPDAGGVEEAPLDDKKYGRQSGAWAEIVEPAPTVTGGAVTQVSIDGVTYNVHTFTSSGDLVITNAPATLEYLVIGGGGGTGASGYTDNGGDCAGGGGAGGYRCSVVGETSGANSPAESKLTLSIGTYPITVGAGGPGAYYSNDPGANGGNSSISTNVVSIGGGGGGSNAVDGRSGGCGGGGGIAGYDGVKVGGTGTSGQGFDGANSKIGQGGSGGSAGSDPIEGFGTRVGLSSSINGTPQIRGVGGMGADPRDLSYQGAAGAANTGNGASSSKRGADKPGGSGIVIVRYKV